MRALNRNTFSKYFQCAGNYIVFLAKTVNFFPCMMMIYTTPDLQKENTLEITECPLVPDPYEATWLEAYTLLSWSSRNKAISFIYWSNKVSLIEPYNSLSIHLSIPPGAEMHFNETEDVINSLYGAKEQNCKLKHKSLKFYSRRQYVLIWWINQPDQSTWSVNTIMISWYNNNNNNNKCFVCMTINELQYCKSY